MAKIVETPIEKIEVGEHSLRMEVEDETLFSLAASIRRIGVLVPLVCRRDADGLHLVAGHRRLAAARQVGLKSVPVVVGEYDNAQSSEVSLAENLFREDLTAVEVAAGIKDIIDQGIMDVPAIAAALHRSEHWVARQIAILDWPDDVLEVIHNGQVSVSAASNLALVDDGVYRNFLLRQAVESGATARTTAAWLQAYRSMAPPEEAVTAEPVAPGERPTPMVPQAPCLVCGEVFRTDELSHVPICAGCIRAVREVGQGGIRGGVS